MERFEIKDYGKRSTFASFLPGVAGIRGIPLWCYYVNRGQGVVSFGVDNKDHGIMEFYPAHTAYQVVKRLGFRTLIRVDGKLHESFADENIPHRMEVSMNSLHLEEKDEDTGLRTRVTYFVLPGERVAGLVRKVEIKNISDRELSYELIDGMPALIPYGVSLDSLKNMAQLSKAWMQVEEPQENLPFYRVRASMVDTASVTGVKGGNFALAVDETGKRLPCIVDPEVIFGYDSSFVKPVEFLEKGLTGVLEAVQKKANLVPSAFFTRMGDLKAGENILIYELIGQVEEYPILKRFLANRKPDPVFFEEKRLEADAVMDELTERVATKTGNKAFDDYTRYTFMDNVLRGGLPIRLGDNKIFYVYSRKHGDLEREYNYFAMSPEFYSQGNGNFRDVNQNRRLDAFFAPFTGKAGVKMFYSLLQADGYNPLSIEKLTYRISEEDLTAILKETGAAGSGTADPEAVKKAVTDKAFTPGELALVCDDEGIFSKIMTAATEDVNAKFGEGYWSDHWTYNLDLIEEYVALYPEEERDLLYEKEYPYFHSGVGINKRSKRYELVDGKVRQYHALEEEAKKTEKGEWLKTTAGTIYQGTLMEKLVLMSTLKFAALDPEQMGIEMEGGKPGWYDALNGLPGLLGSSMAETYELARMLGYTIDSLRKYEGEVELFMEIAELLADVNEILGENLTGAKFWNRINDRKEVYWDKIRSGISGETVVCAASDLAKDLERLLVKTEEGIRKALDAGKGMCPTYFYYDVTSFSKDEEGIHPTAFTRCMVPHFLEGPVRYLKLPNLTEEEKRRLYDHVKDSDLYDRKLKMYKVNASLEDASYELGRCRCFTPGWLENESIWLHMEYKYLLEVLKAGLYPEFFEDARTALIPFMDPEVYGRSILENSSFIASSANPDEKIHGKGFVARLSGSTIEFLSIWKIMMFGKNPFTVKNGSLCFTLTPAIPAYLIGEDLEVSARFMDETRIRYHFTKQADHFPGDGLHKISRMVLKTKNGEKTEVSGAEVTGEKARNIRSGAYPFIDVYF
ncbi:MAG: hypothetical protein IJ589_02760 [Lachnospiraceae bacterium]|nr:hypothetical protein [Lachnospiraceae bacterium]